VLKAFNIVAHTEGPTGSVSFWLNNQYVRTENVIPYTLAGDQNGIFNTWKPEKGHYNLSATPYPEQQAKGHPGKNLTIHFTVLEEPNLLARVSGESSPDLRLNVSLYPVPVGNSLHVKIGDSDYKDASIIIRNIHGRAVYQGPYLQSQEIDTSFLQDGVYFLQITGNVGFQKAIKFIKN
jgi:hypothetical protein